MARVLGIILLLQLASLARDAAGSNFTHFYLVRWAGAPCGPARAPRAPDRASFQLTHAGSGRAPSATSTSARTCHTTGRHAAIGPLSAPGPPPPCGRLTRPAAPQASLLDPRPLARLRQRQLARVLRQGCARERDRPGGPAARHGAQVAQPHGWAPAARAPGPPGAPGQPRRPACAATLLNACAPLRLTALHLALLPGANEEFWNHEWTRHGTCAAPVLATQHDFFAEVLDLHHDFNLEVRRSAACLPACLPACEAACLPARLPACVPACACATRHRHRPWPGCLPPRRPPAPAGPAEPAARPPHPLLKPLDPCSPLLHPLRAQDALARLDIVPSDTRRYKLAKVRRAIKRHLGVDALVHCNEHGELSEVSGGAAGAAGAGAPWCEAETAAAAGPGGGGGASWSCRWAPCRGQAEQRPLAPHPHTTPPPAAGVDVHRPRAAALQLPPAPALLPQGAAQAGAPRTFGSRPAPQLGSRPRRQTTPQPTPTTTNRSSPRPPAAGVARQLRPHQHPAHAAAQRPA
jgi:hypothetical protein